VHADEKLTAFLELESAVRTVSQVESKACYRASGCWCGALFDSCLSNSAKEQARRARRKN
jgi:hypothetical protein